VTAILERAAAIAWRGIAAITADLPADRRRSAALYLLSTSCNLNGAVVARVAGCTKQNVSKARARIEALRDDPVFDAQLEAIEERLAG
jgi:hypothetical protein